MRFVYTFVLKAGDSHRLQLLLFPSLCCNYHLHVTTTQTELQPALLMKSHQRPSVAGSLERDTKPADEEFLCVAHRDVDTGRWTELHKDHYDL